MKIAIFPTISVAVVLIAVLPARAEQRVFTNTKGQEIIAEIVSAKGDIVVLKKDGRTIETAISIYSAEDQAYIRKWMADNPAPVDYNLVIEASKKKMGRSSSPAGYYNYREAPWAYYISIENRSRDTAEGLTLEYRAFKEDNVREQYPRIPRERSEKKGKIKIPELVTHRKANLTTDTFVLGDISYDSTSDYTDELMGLLIRILDSKGNVVAQYKTGTQEIKRMTWETKKIGGP